MNIKYRVVVLENPGLNWTETVQILFSKIAKLKIDGYQYEYGLNVMPINSYDFFGTHLVLCEETDNDLNPLAIAKISKYSVSKYFNYGFQPIELAFKGGNNNLANEVERILNDSMKKYGEITYDSSWTVRPDMRNHKINTIILRIMLSIWTNYHIDNSISEFIISATLKVGTEKMFIASGCIPLTNNPYYKLIEIDNQKAMMFRSGEFSNMILANARKYRDLWANRMIYGQEFNFNKYNTKDKGE